MRLWLALAGLNGLIAVGAGAYGYHDLAVANSGYRDIFLVGVEYQMWHALALLGVAAAADRTTGIARRLIGTAGGAFALGIALFAGQLYVSGYFEVNPVPGIAPMGGILLMAGWALLIGAALAARSRLPPPPDNLR